MRGTPGPVTAQNWSNERDSGISHDPGSGNRQWWKQRIQCVSRGECRQCVNSWRKEGPRETFAGWEDDWEEVDWCFVQAHAPAAWWRAASMCRGPKALLGSCREVGCETQGERCAAVMWLSAGACHVLLMGLQINQDCLAEWESGADDLCWSSVH